MYKRLVLAAALAAAMLLGTEGPADAIIHGEPDGSRHPYVGVLWNDSVSCSGSAISPGVVVTAAHCLEAGSQFWLSFDEQPPVDGRRPSTSAPGVVTGTAHATTAQSDVAVVVLDTQVDLPRYATLPDAGLAATLPSGQVVTDVGYGVDTANGGGVQQALASSAFHREMFTPTLSDVSSSAQFVGLNSPGNNAQVCYGDSGGPVLLGDELVGVNSFVAGQDCSGPGGAARVDLEPVLTAIRSYQ